MKCPLDWVNMALDNKGKQIIYLFYLSGLNQIFGYVLIVLGLLNYSQGCSRLLYVFEVFE